MNIIEYRHDRKLGGALAHMRRPETQRGWDTFLKACWGLPLDETELAIFRNHTGRLKPRRGGYSEATAIIGRQSGKSNTAGDLMAFAGITASAEDAGTYVVGIAQDQRGSMRTLLRYATAPFEQVPILAREADGQPRAADSLALRNGVTLAAYPCRPGAVRGLRARLVVIDELAFFRTSDGNPTDVEMLRAVRPSLATTGGKLFIFSSPYSQTGALWDLHRRHYGRDDSGTLIWVASAPAMNPTLPADYLERMQQDDPEAYRSEVLGEFRAGISTFFDPQALDACVADWRELPWVQGVRHYAHFDASGGQRDGAALAIARNDGDRIAGCVSRCWPAPHNPEVVIREAAALIRSYGCRSVSHDRYGAQFVERAFDRFGIQSKPCALDRSALYLELLPRVLSQTVAIPNDPELLRELRGLERRVSRFASGKDRVDHRPGAHDDRAVALAGAVWSAHDGDQYTLMTKDLGW